MELVELCVTYLVSARMRSRRLNRPMQRDRARVYATGARMSFARYYIYERNRYFHACVPITGRLYADAHTSLVRSLVHLPKYTVY